MPPAPVILALETSCDETAVAVCDGAGTILASEISTQIPDHAPYGGVVPELASRNHIVRVRPLLMQALEKAGITTADVDCYAAASGPGLASSLLVGSTVAKALAVACDKPFLAVNHLEGHLLSPFIGNAGGIQTGIALIVSGGHTMLLHLRGAGDYRLLGRSRDDAAGEAFDKAGKMLGLPYPGGPEIDKQARKGNRKAFDFPRSMLDSGDYAFSFSGLKTSMLYLLPQLGDTVAARMADLCASFQEAIVDILVKKSLRAAREFGVRSISVSGGVSCNHRLREVFAQRCRKAGLELFLAAPALTTDNAAMIAFAALHRFHAGHRSALEEDVNPNLPLVST
ncbi:MAG TPA: tRNA (adenosine(37)-N6)-threonylcarbamoyltransferase complex transferase subunit TsaD [Verrucomicrobiales bacterium]|nr:tRNA (adenosine(37)-N6)-threonylcarbamoyltransferase complex transferase subunit TsaD [Verrucomicrobiales bacterium]